MQQRAHKGITENRAPNVRSGRVEGAGGEGWLPKLKFLLYEDLIAASDAPAFGELDGVLLQSKPGVDGKSQNPHIAKLQGHPSAM